MPALRLPRELVSGKDGCVDLPAQLPGGAPEGLDEIRHPEASDDHKIHIARCKLLATCDRAVDERCGDLACERLECFTKDVREACGFGHESLELRQKWTLGIGLVVDLLALGRPPQHARVDETGQLSLKTRLRCTNLASQLAGEIAALGVHQQHGEQAQAHLGDQGMDSSSRTHIAYL